MLWEIHHSATLIIERTAGLTAEDIKNDIWLRAGVERHFEIVGETARRLIDYDPEVAARIPLLPPAIRLRNFLAHNYDRVDYAQMRDTIDGPLVVLDRAVSELLREVEPILTLVVGFSVPPRSAFPLRSSSIGGS